MFRCIVHDRKDEIIAAFSTKDTKPRVDICESIRVTLMSHQGRRFVHLGKHPRDFHVMDKKEAARSIRARLKNKISDLKKMSEGQICQVNHIAFALFIVIASHYH